MKQQRKRVSPRVSVKLHSNSANAVPGIPNGGGRENHVIDGVKLNPTRVIRDSAMLGNQRLPKFDTMANRAHGGWPIHSIQREGRGY